MEGGKVKMWGWCGGGLVMLAVQYGGGMWDSESAARVLTGLTQGSPALLLHSWSIRDMNAVVFRMRPARSEDTRLTFLPVDVDE